MTLNMYDLEAYQNYKMSQHICYDKLRRYCVTENIDYEYERRSRYNKKVVHVLLSIGHGSNITVTNT